jgi:hypothetical protein
MKIPRVAKPIRPSVYLEIPAISFFLRLFRLQFTAFAK